MTKRVDEMVRVEKRNKAEAGAMVATPIVGIHCVLVVRDISVTSVTKRSNFCDSHFLRDSGT